jgi:uncharacterized protein (DUF1499 family)
MKLRVFLVQAGGVLIVLALFVYGLLAAQLFLIGENPIDFHLDPLMVASVDPHNQFLVAPGAYSAATPSMESPTFKATPRELMQAVDRVARRQPRTKLAAGAPSELWATYVQRSKYMRFPDYISVLAVGLPDGDSTIAVFSQSVYGSRDLGVNKARVEHWLDQLGETVERR